MDPQQSKLSAEQVTVLNHPSGHLVDAGSSTSASMGKGKFSKTCVSVQMLHPANIWLMFFGQRVDGRHFYIVIIPVSSIQKELFKDASFYLAWKGSVKVGSDTTAIPAFHTAVLSADPEQTGVTLSGSENTELVLVIAPLTVVPCC